MVAVSPSAMEKMQKLNLRIQKLNLRMQKLNLRMQKLDFPGTHWRGLALIGTQKNWPNGSILLQFGIKSEQSGLLATIPTMLNEICFLSFAVDLRA